MEFRLRRVDAVYNYGLVLAFCKAKSQKFLVKLCVFRLLPNILEDLNKIKEAVPLLPLVLCNVVFKLGSLAVIISFFRLWSFLLVLLMVIIIFVVENNEKDVDLGSLPLFARFLFGIVSTVSVLLE